MSEVYVGTITPNSSEYLESTTMLDQKSVSQRALINVNKRCSGICRPLNKIERNASNYCKNNLLY